MASFLNTKITHVIIPDIRRGDVEVISRTHSPVDAAAILQIDFKFDDEVYAAIIAALAGGRGVKVEWDHTQYNRWCVRHTEAAEPTVRDTTPFVCITDTVADDTTKPYTCNGIPNPMMPLLAGTMIPAHTQNSPLQFAMASEQYGCFYVGC